MPTFEAGSTALYVFSPSQASAGFLNNVQTTVPANTLFRASLSEYSFQSDAYDAQSFAGPYDLRQLETLPVGVHVGLRWRGRRRSGPLTAITWGLEQIIQAILQFLRYRQSDASYSDIILAMKSADIGNAASLGGWVTRLDAAPPWMLAQIQASS